MSDSIFALGFRFLLLSIGLKDTKEANITSIILYRVIAYKFSILLLSLCSLIRRINLAS